MKRNSTNDGNSPPQVKKKPSSSSSSSCNAASRDLPEPLWPSVPITHRSQQVFQAISFIGTELLYIGSSWSPYIYSSMRRAPQEYIAYEIVLISSAVFRMSGSSNRDSFRDRWSVAVQLLFCGMLLPRLVQYSLHPRYTENKIKIEEKFKIYI